MKKKVLVTGATGFQGTAVVKVLIDKGFEVRGLALENEDTTLLKNAGVEVFLGNFGDENSLIAAFQDIEKVYLSFPLIFDETILLQFAQNVVNAWKQSSVKLFVFNTNLPVYSEKTGLAAFDTKLAIEQYFDAEKLPYISLRPTLYMDNLSAPFLLPVIQNNGILPYPVPANEKIAWISHFDLANFVVSALERPTLVGQKFYIGGIQLISGEEMANIISKYAHKAIHFIPVSPDDFENQLAGGFGATTAKEIANIYRFVGNNVAHLQAKNLRAHTLIHLPVSPQTFDDWASNIDWKN
jgi:NAD(P)H dehydrogenase (quinone)